MSAPATYAPGPWSRLGEAVSELAGRLAGLGDSFTRARRAQRIAEQYLYLDDAELAARGLTREDVIARLRSALCD